MQSWLASVALRHRRAARRPRRRAGARRRHGGRPGRPGVDARCAPADGVVVAPRSLAGIFLTVGAGLWAERPFMIGLISLALLCLAMEERLDRRWLLPIGWVWVNSHGSFPLGLVPARRGGGRAGASTASRGDRELACLRLGRARHAARRRRPARPPGARRSRSSCSSARSCSARSIEWRAPAVRHASSQRLFVAAARAGRRAAGPAARRTASALDRRRVQRRRAARAPATSSVASLVMLPGDGRGARRRRARCRPRDRPRAARVAGAGGRGA